MIKHLYDEIAKRWLEGCGSVYLIGDTHFGDEQSYRLRFPEMFDGIEEGSEDALKAVSELDLWQIKAINRACGKASTLIHLGDVGDLECVKRLKAKRKILIMGNHDKGASNYKRVIEYVTKCPKCGSAELNSLGNNDGFSLYKTQCNVCGFKGDTFGPDFDCVEDNHLFDEVYEGPLMVNDKVILSHEPIIGYGNYLFNIHGHIHNKKYQGDLYHLNCCAEAIDYTPINLLSILKNGLLKNIDSIHRVTIEMATKRKERK